MQREQRLGLTTCLVALNDRNALLPVERDLLVKVLVVIDLDG